MGDSAHARTSEAGGLPLGLAASQLFHLALFRSAGVITGLLGLFRFGLLTARFDFLRSSLVSSAVFAMTAFLNL
jgi:hypothetical protein